MPGLLQGGRVSHKKPGLSQGCWASHWEAGSLTGRPGLSQGDLASHKEAGLSQEGRAAHREARSLTGRPALSQGGQASHRLLHIFWPWNARLSNIVTPITIENAYPENFCISKSDKDSKAPTPLDDADYFCDLFLIYGLEDFTP